MRHDVLHALKSRDVLALWEAGASSSPDRVMDMLLNVVLPDGSAQWIDEASVGQKNVVLLRLCRKWFGSELSACVECSSCGENLETSVQIDDLLAVAEDELPEVYTLGDGAQMRFPRYQDMRNTDAFLEKGDAVISLLRSCLVEGKVMDDAELLNYQKEVEGVIEEYDPLSLISLELQCNDCDTHFESVLDIAFFLLRNFTILGQRMLYDVHVLALHYGWREDEILNMPEVRRRSYMRLIEG